MDYNDNQNPSSYIDPRDYQALQVQDFLRKIGVLESNSGQNLSHPEITTGMHAGTAATGQYGLMPQTAMDLAYKAGVPDLEGLTKQEAQQKLQDNPELGERLAATMASNLLQKNTPEEAAYKWLHGQYSKPTPQQLASSGRVRKFKVLDGK